MLNPKMNELWQAIHGGVFSLSFENSEGRISSGTAFKVGKYLVTNNHVVQVPSARRVVLRSVGHDAYQVRYEKRFGHLEFKQALVDGDPEQGWDYAVLRINDAVFEALPCLDLAQHDEVLIGESVAMFGYQFGQQHQSMHLGHVSSQYEKNGVHYLQLDASINQGNSGGPLISLNSGRVMGIVTRKATGLTEQFDELLKAFRDNIRLLEGIQQGGGFAIVGDIDPVKATLAIQVQMERIAKEIQRSSNVGIGYAYHIRKLRSSLALLE